MASRRVKLVRATRHNGVRYLPGNEKALLGVLSKEEVKSFLDKNLLYEVAPEGEEIGDGASGQPSELEAQLVQLLQPHASTEGDGETPDQTLQRIIQERDEFQVQANAVTKERDALKTKNTALTTELKDAKAKATSNS